MSWQTVVLVLGVLLSLEVFVLLWGVLIRPQDRELEYHKLAQQEELAPIKIDIPSDDDTMIQEPRNEWEPQ